MEPLIGLEGLFFSLPAGKYERINQIKGRHTTEWECMNVETDSFPVTTTVLSSVGGRINKIRIDELFGIVECT